MSGFLELFWFIVVTSILVAWHEWGHYWVAKKLGVKAVRYAIGFGKTLYSRSNAIGTEFAIKALPLGGYVKFVDTREGDVPEADLPFAFDQQKLWKRSLIILAGPVANLVLTLVALTVMFMVGVADERAVIGRVAGMAEKLGLQRGDEIVAIDQKQVSNWTEALIELTQGAYDEKTVQIRVRPAEFRSAPLRELSLDLRTVPKGFDEKSSVLRALGLQPFIVDVPAGVAATQPDSPALAAGLLAGDLVQSINGVRVNSARELLDVVQQQSKLLSGKLELVIQRGATSMTIPVQAKLSGEGSDARWIIGIALLQSTKASPYSTARQLGLFPAMVASGQETWYFLTRSLSMMKSLLNGQASAKNISGPFTIAEAAKATADLGLSEFLRFVALVSLSLFIVNLLPIPVLDGGHLLFNTIEAVKGSPPSEKLMAAGQIFGLTVILGLMSLAIYNDIARRFGQF